MFKRRRIDFKEMILSVLNISLIFFFFKTIFSIIHRISGHLGTFMKIWGFDSSSGTYYVIDKIYDNGKGVFLLWVILGIFCFLFALTIIWLVSRYNKQKLLIIEHSSLQKMSFTYDKDELSKYYVKRMNLDQHDTLQKPSATIDTVISALIDQIDSIIPTVQIYTAKGYLIAYAGIANIPATFLLGFELGDENKKHLFHKYRNEEMDDHFHLLKNDGRHYPFKGEILKPCDPHKPSNVLIVIQLTKLISASDYQSIQEDNDTIVKYEIPETIHYDVVDSIRQINQYADMIIAYIAKLQKEPNVQKIKICIAASSAFVFALGTKFSKTQDKEVIIYHFQNNTYPWGINVTQKKIVR